MAQQGSGVLLMEKTWEKIQQKTFTKWVNSYLQKRSLKIENLQTDLRDGIMLCQFLEIIGAEELPKYERRPKIRVQQVSNVGIALNYLKYKNVKLVAIGPEDIVDGNLKLILGMIWTIIQRFQIEDINEEQMTAKEALLLWCRKKTAGYKDVNITNFHTSWQDGLGFCALIHAHRPDLLDFHKLDKSNARENLKLAFEIAERDLGIPALLDVEDIVDVAKPDERSIITYVSQYYHKFASSNKADIAGRRIGKLIDFASNVDQMQQDFLDRAGKLVAWIKNKKTDLDDRNLGSSLQEVKDKIGDLQKYKDAEKPPKEAELINLEALFNALQLQLKNAKRPAFVPPAGLGVNDLEDLWEKLLAAERAREDALRKELERQERLNYLNKKFALKSDALEKWVAAKKGYLEIDEAVDSITTAQSKLKLVDAFDEEYAASRARLQQVQQLAKEIADLQGANAKEVNDKADALSQKWHGLQPLGETKRKNLKDKLEREFKKEEARKDWAKQAQEYIKFQKGAVNDVATTHFGDTIEAIEAFQPTLNASNNQFTISSTNKKGDLDNLWDQLTKLGVTENRYTPLTIKEIHTAHDALLDEIKKRDQAYQDELLRQRELEKKRKEFAEKADAFAKSLQNKRETIQGNTGEPQHLIQQAKGLYDDNKAEKEKLNELAFLQEGLAKLGVKENRHTPHTLPSLKALNTDYVTFVKNYLRDLDEEEELKREFLEKARALNQFLGESTPQMKDRTTDNTLAGAQDKKNKQILFRTTVRADKESDLAALDNLNRKIAKLLEANGRPQWHPEAGLSLDSLNAEWTTFEKEEKAYEDFVFAEVVRQEKMASLVKRFNSDAEDLDHWVKDKENYLKKDESVTDLRSARLAFQYVKLFEAEYEASDRLPQLKSLGQEIIGLQYKDSDAIKNRLGGLDTHWTTLKDLSTKKRSVLQQQLQEQERKEKLRLEYAQQTKEFQFNVNKAIDYIDNYNFGYTLDSVNAYKSELDKNDVEYNRLTGTKKEAIDKLWEELQAAGIHGGDLKYTTATPQTINTLYGQYQEAINKRRKAYDEEVKRQQHNDTLAKGFGDKANGFVTFLKNQRDELEKVEGDATAKIAGVTGKFNSGHQGKSLLDELAKENATLQGAGVYHNKHSGYTLPALVTLNTQHDRAIDNFVADLKEEHALEERAKVQRAEREAREKRENMKIDYGRRGAEFSQWLESAQEVIGEPTTVKSVEEVDQLEQALGNLRNQIPQQQTAHESIQQAARTLQQNNIDDYSGFQPDAFQQEWNQITNDVGSRQTALDEERKRQQTNENLRVQFAEKAKSVSNDLNTIKNTITKQDGDAQSQLNALKALPFESVKTNLTAAEGLSNQLFQAGVSSNKHTELSYPLLFAQYNQLVDAKQKKEKVLNQELLGKSNTGLSAEQIAELREVFNHFDRNKSGRLDKLELLGVLKSLGEDISDKEIDNLVRQLDPTNTGRVEFEAFAGYMAKKITDSDSKDQIIEAFQTLAGDKEFILEEDLRRSLPSEKVDYLLKAMPAYPGVARAYDYKAFANKSYGN